MNQTPYKPIIVVGTHRSGTTFLGEIIRNHPDVAYWEEPRHIWSRGNAFKPDDALDERDVTPRKARAIKRSFTDFMERAGRSRFAEKTPSNCLRLPFIHTVFPDARFVHIYRDGRAVVRSTQQMLTTKAPRGSFILKRLAGTPVWEWPALASRFSMTLGNRLRGRAMAYWGPRPPGWRQWVEEGTQRHVLLARQWAHTVTPTLDFRDNPKNSDTKAWLDISYEELAQSPGPTIRRVLQFCELYEDKATLENAEQCADASRREAWRDELAENELRDMRPILEPTLNRLGYTW